MTTPSLVTTDWVTEASDRDDVVIADVDEDTTAYDDRGHIPGAIAFHWKQDFQDPVRRAFLDAKGFATLMDRKGVHRDDHVVLYGGNNNWFAAYAFWYFKVYGHERVSLMDGGRIAWEAEGRPLTQTADERPTATGYPTVTPDESIRVRRDDVLARYVGAPAGTALIDVRSPAEFRGEALAPDHLPQEAAQVAGHIPGATNVPWSTAVDGATGRFKPREELEALYRAAGAEPDADIVAYCRIGERSAHTWFVLHELLDRPQVRNYDGSWTEYGSLVDVPVAVGDQ